MSSEPEEVTVYVTNKNWESKVSFDQPYLEHPWLPRVINEENPHHWAFRSFKAYKGPPPHLTRVDFNMTTFYTPKDKTDKMTTYWVCRRNIDDGRVNWWIVTPNQEEQKKVAPSPRHKEFYSWTIEEEFYATPICQKCLWQSTKVQIECDCNPRGKDERRNEVQAKPTGPPAIGSKPTFGTDEVSVLISNRRWESRAALEKPYTKEYTLGFEDGNMHHWAFKAFKAWKSPDKGRIKVTIDKIEFYAYEEEPTKENPHEGVLYYACQKPDSRSWWIFCPAAMDKLQYQKEGSLYGWKPLFQFYAKPDRESEAYFLEKEDRRRWQCEDCNHINPGYRFECEFCYENRLKDSKQGIEVRRLGERAKSPTTVPTSTDDTKPSYSLSLPKKYSLPFQPGTPSKASLLDLIQDKEK